MTLYRLDERHYVDFMNHAPDELGSLAGFTTTPDGDPVLALIAVYNGSVAIVESALAPLRTFSTAPQQHLPGYR